MTQFSLIIVSLPIYFSFLCDVYILFHFVLQWWISYVFHMLQRNRNGGVNIKSYDNRNDFAEEEFVILFLYVISILAIL